MKKLLIVLLCLIPFYASAEYTTGGNGKFADIRPDGNGNYKINPGQDFRQPKVSQYNSWVYNSDKFTGTISGGASVSNKYGATATSTVQTKLKYNVPKKAVSKSLFNKSKIIGKKVIDRAPIVGWILLAAELMQSDLEDEGYSPREELNGEYGRQPATTDYVIFVTSKNLGISTISGVQTNMSLKAYCDSKSVTCTNLGVVSQDSIQAKKDDYCKSVAPLKNSWGGELSSAKYGNSTCEFKYKRPGGITDSELGTQSIIHARTGEYVALSENEFERIFMPQMELEPAPYVSASADSQSSSPPSVSYAAELSSPASSASVKTDPYTNPMTKKAQQSTYSIAVNNNSWVIDESVQMRPDLDGNTELAPEPIVPNEEDTKDPETPTTSASIPLQCDSDKYPNSLGCVDTTEEIEQASMSIPQETVPLDFQVKNYITSSTGTCPQGSQFTLNFFSTHTYEFSFEPVCKFAEMIKYALWVCSWLIAYYIVIGRPE